MLIALIVYLVVLNIAGFVSMHIDKQKAIKNEWRVPEATLFLIAIFGGSIGSILGMQMFRHKTKHAQFVVGMPLILIVQLVIAFFVYTKL